MTIIILEMGLFRVLNVGKLHMSKIQDYNNVIQDYEMKEILLELYMKTDNLFKKIKRNNF